MTSILSGQMARTVKIDQWLNFAKTSTIDLKRDDETSRVLSELLKTIVSGKAPKWYGVTDVINPTHKYYELQFPDIPEDQNLLTKFKLGNEIQEIAFQWFQGIEESVVREVEITGETIGLPGIRGRLDFSLPKSIVEFKTTTHKIYEANDIFANNPQDLEQLCIYALLSSRLFEEHCLVYFSEDFEHFFRVFRVRISDPTYIRALAKERLELLNESVRKGSTSNLGRCRYFDFGCKFKTSNTCNCEHLAEYDTDILRSKLMVERDKEMEMRLYQQKKIVPGNDIRTFSLWDLVTPRKAYLKYLKLLDEESDETDKENTEILKAVNIALSNSNQYVERRDLVSNGYFLGNTTILSMKMNSESKDSSPRLYPSVIRIYQGTPSNLVSNTISSYFLLRLAMVCSLSGSDSGYLIVGFKEDKKKLDCYRIRFSRLREMKSWINARLAEISHSLESHDPTDLPKCPDFLVKSCGKSCLCEINP